MYNNKNANDINEGFKSTFFIIPGFIMDLPDISLSHIKFYETIFQFWNKNLDCFLSNSCIMQRTGIKSISTINDCFQYFEKHNQMKRVTVNGQRYIIQPERKIRTDMPVDKGIAGAIGGYRQGDSKGIAGAIHNINNLTKETNTTTYEIIPSTKVSPNFEQESSSSFVNAKTEEKKETEVSQEYKNFIHGNEPIEPCEEIVISEYFDKQILLAKEQRKDRYGEKSPKDFLEECKTHLKNGDKEKFNEAQRLNGLRKLIIGGHFMAPANHNKQNLTKEERRAKEFEAQILRREASKRKSNLTKAAEEALGALKDILGSKVMQVEGV